MVTLEELKGYLKITSPNQDTQLQILLDGAISLVDAQISDEYTLTELKQTESVLPGKNTIYLNYYNVPISDVYLEPDFSLLQYIKIGNYIEVTSPVSGTVLILYNHSSTRAIPSAIKLAVMELVNHWMSKAYVTNRSSSGGQSVSSVPQVGGIPLHVLAMLSPYREI